MNWTDILLAAGILSGIGIVFGVVLGISAKKFYVEEDPRVEELRSCLGGANCGACGFAGCDAFAKALIEGQACPEDCTAASADNLEKIGQIMQVEVSEREPRVARVLCQGAFSVSKKRYDYEGYSSCRAVAQMAGGNKQCHYACIGLGDCAKKCAFDAIDIVDGVAIINADKCTACGECVLECPRHVIELIPKECNVTVRCSNHERAKIAKDACMRACIACGRCAKACPQEAITIENYLAHIDPHKCNNCGECVPVCPSNCIVVQTYKCDK